jgi:hypothetical protein
LWSFLSSLLQTFYPLCLNDRQPSLFLLLSSFLLLLLYFDNSVLLFLLLLLDLKDIVPGLILLLLGELNEFLLHDLGVDDR